MDDLITLKESDMITLLMQGEQVTEIGKTLTEMWVSFIFRGLNHESREYCKNT